MMEGCTNMTVGAVITAISYDDLRLTLPSKKTEISCLPMDVKQLVNSIASLRPLMLASATSLRSTCRENLRTSMRFDNLTLNSLQCNTETTDGVTSVITGKCIKEIL